MNGIADAHSFVCRANVRVDYYNVRVGYSIHTSRKRKKNQLPNSENISFVKKHIIYISFGTTDCLLNHNRSTSTTVALNH